jgi:hypothetical protein
MTVFAGHCHRGHDSDSSDTFSHDSNSSGLTCSINDGETDTFVVEFFSASRAAYEAIRFLIKFHIDIYRYYNYRHKHR